MSLFLPLYLSSTSSLSTASFSFVLFLLIFCFSAQIFIKFIFILLFQSPSLSPSSPCFLSFYFPYFISSFSLPPPFLSASSVSYPLQSYPFSVLSSICLSLHNFLWLPLSLILLFIFLPFLLPPSSCLFLPPFSVLFSYFPASRDPHKCTCGFSVSKQTVHTCPQSSGISGASEGSFFQP